MKKSIKILYGVLLITFACNQAPKGTNAELMSDVKNGGVLLADSITACPHSSKILWTGSKPVGKHTGIIKLKEGNYFVNGDNLVGGEFTLDMNSIVDIDLDDSAMNAKLVGHLKSVDFFNVDSFPEGKFVITEVEGLKDDKYTHKITGNLTLKSITHPISFRANLKVGEGKVSATTEQFMLNRTQWNVNYGSKSIFKELTDKFISDDFEIQLEMHSM